MDAYAPERARGILEDLLRQAGRMALDAQMTNQHAERKSDGSPVTQADRAIDAYLASALPTAFPGCGVEGEEGAHVEGDTTWYVDPIDGTRSYLQRLAYWGPTVCLVRDGELLLGAFYVPVVDEFWFAARGYGAFRGDERLQMPDPPAPRDRVLFAPSRFHRSTRFEWAGRVRVLGSVAAHMALVAAGAGAVALVPRWKCWDVGCGALLVQEAGGVLSDLEGCPMDKNLAIADLPFAAGASTALNQLLTR